MKSRLRSVRWRSALASAAALAPVLLIGGTAVVIYQRHELTNAAAVVAEDQARAAMQTLDGDSATPKLEPTSSNEPSLLQVVSADGTVLAASPALGDRAALLTAPSAGRVRRESMDDLEAGEHDSYVVVAVPSTDGSGSGSYVIAARSLEPVNTASASTAGILAVGAPLLLVVVTGLGYLLAGRALRPVEEMRRHAAAITAADLSARLPSPGTGDEVARLAQTMNEMLERLQHSADTQRRFVADASHELRSPLATIRTLHEVAASAPVTDWVELNDDVLAETTRLERLVADLLLLARSDAGVHPRLVELSLTDLVVAATDYPRRLPVQTSALESVTVLGHPDSLTRAVRNLIDNADRHGATQILLTVGVERQRGETVAVVRIADDGPGIAPVDVARVFERFVRLDEARARDDGGAGLGLPIAQEIVAWHGGSLSVHSTVGATVFEIVVPALRSTA